MSDWAVGLSTGCFLHSNILDCLEPIRASGFARLEICSFPAHLDYHDLDVARRAGDRLRELDLEAYSFHSPFAPRIDLSSSDSAIRDHAKRETVQAAEAAAALGARHFVIHPGPEEGFPEDQRLRRMEIVAQSLTEISDRCRELGIGFVLENKLPHLFAGQIRDLMWILGALETTEVGVCLDTGHAHLAGDLLTAAHKLSGHLRLVHASDNRGRYDDHLAPGDGEIPWERLLRQLDRVHFRGTLILEVAGEDSHEATLAKARHGRRYLAEIERRLTQAPVRED